MQVTENRFYKENIKLSADETMLLLITKNHLHKNVPQGSMQTGSFEYIQACCNYRCAITVNAHVFTIYLPLCVKLLSSHQFGNVLEEIHKQVTGNFFIITEGKLTRQQLCEFMFSALANRITTDLELDESLIAKREKINA